MEIAVTMFFVILIIGIAIYVWLWWNSSGNIIGLKVTKWYFVILLALALAVAIITLIYGGDEWIMGTEE